MLLTVLRKQLIICVCGDVLLFTIEETGNSVKNLLLEKL